MYEKKILGSILANYSLIDQYSIKESMFYEEIHRKVFASILKEKSKGFKSFDGSEFEKELMDICFNISAERVSDKNFQNYINLLTEYSKKLELKDLLENITEKIEDKETCINDLLGIMYQKFNSIKNNGNAVDDVYNSEEIVKIVDKFETNEIKRVSDIKYGYELLDRYALGMHPKQITLLAARTGTGKSSFAINLLNNVGVKQKQKILYLSNEMDKERSIKRLQSCISGIDSEHFWNMNAVQKYKYDIAKQEIKNSKILITGNYPKTIDDASLIIRRNNVDNDLKVVIYDYLGETKQDGAKGLKEWEKLTQYTQQLLEIAKEQNIHIVILNQFSKESEKGNSFNARGSMLGGSEILHKVDRFLYFDYDVKINKYILSIEKNRDGDCKKIIYDFMKHTQQISELYLYDDTTAVADSMPDF